MRPRCFQLVIGSPNCGVPPVLFALSLKSRTHAHPLAPARPVRRQHPAVLTAPAAEAKDHPWKTPHRGGLAAGEGASERRAPAVGLRSPSQQWGRGVNADTPCSRPDPLNGAATLHSLCPVGLIYVPLTVAHRDVQ